MFYETEEGRIQNLTLLQDVIVTTNGDNFAIGYVQINGEIIKEGSYTKEQALTKLEAIKTELTK